MTHNISLFPTWLIRLFRAAPAITGYTTSEIYTRCEALEAQLEKCHNWNDIQAWYKSIDEFYCNFNSTKAGHDLWLHLNECYQHRLRKIEAANKTAFEVVSSRHRKLINHILNPSM